MMNLSYLADHILYQTFKSILNIFNKKHGENTDNHSIRMCVNKIENRIRFKIKTGYYLEILTTETMKLLGSTKSKIIKDKNGKNVLNIETTEVALVHCNIININY